MSLKNLKSSTPYPWLTLSSTRYKFQSVTKTFKVIGVITDLRRSLPNGHASILEAAIQFPVVYMGTPAKFVIIRKWWGSTSTYRYLDHAASVALGSSLLPFKRNSCSKGKHWMPFGVTLYGGWTFCWRAAGPIVTSMVPGSPVLSWLVRGKRLFEERRLPSQSWGETGCGWRTASLSDRHGRAGWRCRCASCVKQVQMNPGFTTRWKGIPVYGTRSTPPWPNSWWDKCLTNQVTRWHVHVSQVTSTQAVGTVL